MFALPLFQRLFLSFLQGVTEFLPISSSAHLILASRILDLKDQGPLVDVMAHAGTLCAVLLYFHKDVAHLLRGFWLLVLGKKSEETKLATGLVVVSLPVLTLGFFLHALSWDMVLRSLPLIAVTTFVFGVLLWRVDVKARAVRTVEGFGIRDALILGFAQTLALIPGVSRSGIVMTAARGLGFERESAARLALLSAIPVLGAFGLYAGLELALKETQVSQADALFIGFFSFLIAYCVLYVFMRFLPKLGFWPFALYRFILSLLILGVMVWR